MRRCDGSGRRVPSGVTSETSSRQTSTGLPLRTVRSCRAGSTSGRDGPARGGIPRRPAAVSSRHRMTVLPSRVTFGPPSTSAAPGAARQKAGEAGENESGSGVHGSSGASRPVSRRPLHGAYRRARPPFADGPAGLGVRFPGQMSTSSLVGAWKLLVLEFRSDGQVVYPVGRDAAGTCLYDATGHMSLQIMRVDRPRFASGDLLSGAPEDVAGRREGVHRVRRHVRRGRRRTASSSTTSRTRCFRTGSAPTSSGSSSGPGTG